MSEALVSAVRKVCGANPAVYLHEPSLTQLEHDFVTKCVESTYVSSVGEYVDRFEQGIAEYTGANRAIAVVNGTAALQVSLLLAGVRKDEEVLVPGLTFVATANAVTYCGAIPHFVDSEQETLGICSNSLDAYLSEISEFRAQGCFNKNTGRRIAAVVPVHIFGHPCKLEGILEVAEKYNLVVVEDAAESLGSFYKGKHTGTFGLLGTLSFNGNKIITTGGGGAILTNDNELADQAKHLTTTAKVTHRWNYVHDQIGYNYRMPNLNAALGCAQLQRLPDFLASKRKLFKIYHENLSAIDGIHLFQEPTYCSSNYWLQTVILEESDLALRDELLVALNNAGLMCRPAWTCLHKLKPFESCPRMGMETAEVIERKILNLPSSFNLIT